MKKSVRVLITFLLFLVILAPIAKSTDNPFGIISFGHFKKMVHQNNTKGVVYIKKAVSSANTYAIGALEGGVGEITVINNRIWLDYGQDGFGNSKSVVPYREKAVILVTANVSSWDQIAINADLTETKLKSFIMERANIHSLDTDEPFVFIIEGWFNHLDLHVIDGENTKFDGHGGKETFYKQHKTNPQNKKAIILGFFSARRQGVYTHPGDSWHMHAVLEDKNIGAHVDGVTVKKYATLKLPGKKNK